MGRRKGKPLRGWKGVLLDLALGLVTRTRKMEIPAREEVKSILVLRSNDLGDLLVTTPLFHALRDRFPRARICAGIGEWGREVLEGNPHISDVMTVNAPFGNHAMQGRGLAGTLRYCVSSPDVRALARERFDIGIDVFGSGFGSLLLWRAGVKYRIGVRGGLGGWTSVHWANPFDVNEHVAAANLHIAEHLLAGPLPEAKPEIYLSREELERGESLWSEINGEVKSGVRVALAPGSGAAEKNWPGGHFQALARQLEESAGATVAVLGGPGDRALGNTIVAGRRRVRSFAGALRLRESFALLAGADVVICNGSMVLHAAAAFRKPTVVVLGQGFFESAAAHEALWGYPGLGPTLGGGASGEMASVAQVFEATMRLIKKQGLMPPC